MAHRRAGGHIDRGDGQGWVLDDTPDPEPPAPIVPPPPEPGPKLAGGWVLTPDPEPPAEPEPQPQKTAATPVKRTSTRPREK